MRAPALLLGLCMLLPGCGHRAAAVQGDSGSSDRRVADGLLPDQPPPQSCGAEHLVLRRFDDPAGNFTLATREGETVAPVSIAGAGSGESAAVITAGPVGGLVVVRPSSLEPGQAIASVQQGLASRLQAAGLGTLDIRASGALGRSHDGLPHLKGAVWDVTAAAPLDLAQLRHQLLAAALERPAGDCGSGPPTGLSGASLVVHLSLVLRGGRIALSAAVLRRQDDDDTSSQAGPIADDLANGSGLAGPGAETELRCDVDVVASQPMADIIWVIDESLSMEDNRQSIVDNANLFFAKALAANLDFRMGVTGVRKPDGWAQMGKLCSREGPQADDGGEDRFLAPGEKEAFSTCVSNPPYFENSFEYGLTNAYWAVKRHLPRADSPGRIRPGAKLAVIIASDEVPQELKVDGSFEGNPGFLGLADLSRCTLDHAKQAKLQSTIQPLLQLFSGRSDPSTKATVHLIGGLCASHCTDAPPEVAHGYLELAKELGGQIGDICQKDLGPTLQVIIDSIAAAASPRVLHEVPISASLEVALNGAPVPRSRRHGFLYDAHANALTFVDIKVSKGDWVVATYRSFSR